MTAQADIAAAARVLLDSPLPSDYSSFWANHFAQPLQRVRADTQAVLVFRIGTEWLAVPARKCREVVERRPIHTLPHRRDSIVLGIVNIGGSLLPCVSLGAILGVAPQADARSTETRGLGAQRFVVIATSKGAVVIPADEVQGVERVNADSLTQPPATVTQASATYTKGLIQLKGNCIGLLDDGLLDYAIHRSLA